MRPINLLPPELELKKEARRRVVGLIVLGIAFLALLALITYWQNGKVQIAKDDLAGQEQINQETQLKITALASAQDLRTQYEDDVSRVESVLATDVPWAKLFNDLARVIPDRVWLTSFSGSVAVDETDPEVVGQVQVGATAFDYPDASAWLRVIDSDVWPAVARGWVTSAQAATIGDNPVVDFQSSASLTTASVSSRVDNRIPTVPE
ncbi:MAG: PilN domain-containing protein [Acidimicrobiia bacterium]